MRAPQGENKMNDPAPSGRLVLVDLYALITPHWTPAVSLFETPDWAKKYTRIVTAISAVTAPGTRKNW